MTFLRLILLIFLTQLIINCASIQAISDSKSKSDTTKTVVRTSQDPISTDNNFISHKSFKQVNVFYGTDRKIKDTTNLKQYFSADRGNVSYGTVQVSIPSNHDTGKLESPNLLKLEFKEDPQKHIVLLDIKKIKKDQYFKELSENIKTFNSKSALIFIHGYNVTFEDAARRTAQMAHDLDFNGAPIFYSWPSQGSLPKYTYDETNIKWTESNIKDFLYDVITKTDTENIYLIAHSMGNRGLTRAYTRLLQESPNIASYIKEIILAAPDIDADIFKRDIAPEMLKFSAPITLYASSNDKPLKASKAIHAKYPRIGDSENEVAIIDGIETIDASQINTSFLGHSYFASDKSLIKDISRIINNKSRANDRTGLKEIQSELGKYWKLIN